jgi:hypothetical protein
MRVIDGLTAAAMVHSVAVDLLSTGSYFMVA